MNIFEQEAAAAARQQADQAARDAESRRRFVTVVDQFLAAATRMGISPMPIVRYKYGSGSISIKGILGEGWRIAAETDNYYVLTTEGVFYPAYFSSSNGARQPYGIYSLITRLKYDPDKKKYEWVAAGSAPIRPENMGPFTVFCLERGMKSHFHGDA